jgi:hypothetical protein
MSLAKFIHIKYNKFQAMEISDRQNEKIIHPLISTLSVVETIQTKHLKVNPIS